jgi:hypothetical protein
MIYFVSYVLGLARENSENAISDHLETPNFRNFLKCSAFISAQQPFTTKSSPRKNNILQSGPSPPDGRNFLYGRSAELPSLTVYPWVSRFSRWPPGLTVGLENLTDSHKNTISENIVCSFERKSVRVCKVGIKKQKSEKVRSLLFK